MSTTSVYSGNPPTETTTMSHQNTETTVTPPGSGPDMTIIKPVVVVSCVVLVFACLAAFLFYKRYKFQHRMDRDDEQGCSQGDKTQDFSAVPRNYNSEYLSNNDIAASPQLQNELSITDGTNLETQDPDYPTLNEVQLTNQSFDTTHPDVVRLNHGFDNSEYPNGPEISPASNTVTRNQNGSLKEPTGITVSSVDTRLEFPDENIDNQSQYTPLKERTAISGGNMDNQELYDCLKESGDNADLQNQYNFVEIEPAKGIDSQNQDDRSKESTSVSDEKTDHENQFISSKAPPIPTVKTIDNQNQHEYLKLIGTNEDQFLLTGLLSVPTNKPVNSNWSSLVSNEKHYECLCDGVNNLGTHNNSTVLTNAPVKSITTQSDKTNGVSDPTLSDSYDKIISVNRGSTILSNQAKQQLQLKNGDAKNDGDNDQNNYGDNSGDYHKRPISKSFSTLQFESVLDGDLLDQVMKEYNKTTSQQTEKI